jgi:hypothetical protein
MGRFFDKHGLLDFDQVKLTGIKPRASQEWTTGSDQPMEVQDSPMMPSIASLISKNSLLRMKMKRVSFE